MSVQKIQVLMTRLANLHTMFEQTNYQLSELDKQSLKGTIEQLNVELILSKKIHHKDEPNFTNKSVTEAISSEKIAEPFPAEEARKQGTAENLVENNIEQPFDLILDQPTPSPVSIDKPIDEVNNEIDELFFPQPKEENLEQIPEKQPTNNVVLGLNERIMFAKSLFNNDVNALQNKIKEFKEYDTKEQMLSEFDHHYFPDMLVQGKDEEVLSEFRAMLQRVF